MQYNLVISLLKSSHNHCLQLCILTNDFSFIYSYVASYITIAVYVVFLNISLNVLATMQPFHARMNTTYMILLTEFLSLLNSMEQFKFCGY